MPQTDQPTQQTDRQKTDRYKHRHTFRFFWVTSWERAMVTHSVTDKTTVKNLCMFVLSKVTLQLTWRPQRCTLLWPQGLNTSSRGLKVHWAVPAAEMQSRKNISEPGKIPFVSSKVRSLIWLAQISVQGKTLFLRATHREMFLREAAQTSPVTGKPNLEIAEGAFWLWLLHPPPPRPNPSIQSSH